MFLQSFANGIVSIGKVDMKLRKKIAYKKGGLTNGTT